MVRAAVVLYGSGRFDGSEIQGSVFRLLHPERHGVAWQAFAPDAPQWAVCVHFDGVVQVGEHRIVSTPGDILGPDLVCVDRGIGRCISEALRLCPS